MASNIEQNLNMTPQEDLIRLRTRLLDLQKTGLLNPDNFGTYQQTILQIWQESERRRASCLQQAATLRQQAAAAEAQSHAFSVIGSIIYSVVNGYIELEERRAREEQERALEKERAAAEESSEEPEAPHATSEEPDSGNSENKTSGRRKKL
jgi:hypothetical protein